MKLHEKIYQLRKQSGLSQEEAAEHLRISRQALSRWENGTAMPDAENLLELSKLFQVTADYLLNDEYQSDNDLPKVKETKTSFIRQLMIVLITIEVVTVILQLLAPCFVHYEVFQALGFLLLAAAIGGFEYAYQKNANKGNEEIRRLRKRFYTISAWLGTYFPIRFLVMKLLSLYPRPVNALVPEGIIAVLYLILSSLITRKLNKK